LAVEDFVERAMHSQRGVQVDGDAVLIRPDGAQMPVSILASPVMEEEKVKGCIVVFRDTTDQRALDQMKSEFIALASHQLRTPLTGIRWYTSTLAEGQSGTLNPRQQELVKDIEGCTQQMVAPVNDLLNVARLDQGTLKLNLVPVSLTELVPEVRKTLQTKAERFRVSLVLDESLASSPPVRADKALLTEVLLNVVDNAIKYTPEHGTVRLLASQEDKNLVVSVSDTGVGIPATEMHKLFQKFSRVENPLSNRERGSGLGLYFAKGILEKHGGKLWAESSEGKGSTFHIALPLSDATKGGPNE